MSILYSTGEEVGSMFKSWALEMRTCENDPEGNTTIPFFSKIKFLNRKWNMRQTIICYWTTCHLVLHRQKDPAVDISTNTWKK